MNNLSKEELYLLLICVIDNIDTDNIILKENMRPFEDEVMELKKLKKLKM